MHTILGAARGALRHDGAIAGALEGLTSSVLHKDKTEHKGYWITPKAHNPFSSDRQDTTVKQSNSSQSHSQATRSQNQVELERLQQRQVELKAKIEQGQAADKKSAKLLGISLDQARRKRIGEEIRVKNAEALRTGKEKDTTAPVERQRYLITSEAHNPFSSDRQAIPTTGAISNDTASASSGTVQRNVAIVRSVLDFPADLLFGNNRE